MKINNVKKINNKQFEIAFDILVQFFVPNVYRVIILEMVYVIRMNNYKIVNYSPLLLHKLLVNNANQIIT